MRFETLYQWLAWQETLHPSEIELGLGRVAQVLRRLNLQNPGFTVVTVAGTNGKGSSVAMLEAVLLAAGYRVGAYSSPHLLRYNERVRINGVEVEDGALCTAFERIDRARAEISLTYFEFATLAAIENFQHARVDIAILEVGLGGRLDAVNVLDADVALITAIDLDHQEWLGQDREAIGGEKAGILRSARPAVCSDPHPPHSLLDTARQLSTPLWLLGRDFQAQAEDVDTWRWIGPEGESISLPYPALGGDFQLQNAAGVVMVLQVLSRDFPLDAAAIRCGLSQVSLPGRFQRVGEAPLQILDVAHNPQSARALAASLLAQPCQGRTRVVLAMLADKDIPAVIAGLRDMVDDWYLAPLRVARGASVELLQQALPDSASKSYASVADAYAAARQEAIREDRIVVLGSFYTVAAVLAHEV